MDKKIKEYKLCYFCGKKYNIEKEYLKSLKWEFKTFSFFNHLLFNPLTMRHKKDLLIFLLNKHNKKGKNNE